MSVEFDAHECTCDDSEFEHDDGFGCTVKDCDCLAGWSIKWPEETPAEASPYN